MDYDLISTKMLINSALFIDDQFRPSIKFVCFLIFFFFWVFFFFLGTMRTMWSHMSYNGIQARLSTVIGIPRTNGRHDYTGAVVGGSRTASSMVNRGCCGEKSERGVLVGSAAAGVDEIAEVEEVGDGSQWAYRTRSRGEEGCCRSTWFRRRWRPINAGPR